jgi:hypothetical protein
LTDGENFFECFTGVVDGVMVMESCKATVTKCSKLIVYCTGVGDGVVVMDSSTQTVTECGKLIVR